MDSHILGVNNAAIMHFIHRNERAISNIKSFAQLKLPNSDFCNHHSNKILLFNSLMVVTMSHCYQFLYLFSRHWHNQSRLYIKLIGHGSWNYYPLIS